MTTTSTTTSATAPASRAARDYANLTPGPVTPIEQQVIAARLALARQVNELANALADIETPEQAHAELLDLAGTLESLRTAGLRLATAADALIGRLPA